MTSFGALMLISIAIFFGDVDGQTQLTQYSTRWVNSYLFIRLKLINHITCILSFLCFASCWKKWTAKEKKKLFFSFQLFYNNHKQSHIHSLQPVNQPYERYHQQLERCCSMSNHMVLLISLSFKLLEINVIPL